MAPIDFKARKEAIKQANHRKYWDRRGYSAAMDETVEESVEAILELTGVSRSTFDGWVEKEAARAAPTEKEGKVLKFPSIK